MSETRIIPVVLSADTSAFANGDVIADTQLVSNVFRENDGKGMLESVTVFDADDQTAYDFDVYILRANVSMGTENAAISITDANAVAAELKRVVFTGSTDAGDLINSKMYQKAALGIPVRAALSSRDLYIAMVCRTGTPTHTAAGITVVLGFRID